MHAMSQNKFSYFIQVIYSIRKHYIKNEYFPMHILFSKIYLLQEQKFNHKKKSEQEINMGNFVQAFVHDVHMYAKFGNLAFP
jgi:hypothetical protein